MTQTQTPASLAAALQELARSMAQAAAGAPLPILATPEQIYAERLTLAVLDHPAVRTARAATLARLRDHPNSQSADGAATLDRAVLLWTTTLIMQTICEHISPAFLVYADDTPHTWFGHEFPGVGVSGDNPDNIYRVAEIDGSRRYEVRGIMPGYRPAQITITLAWAMSGGGTANAKTSDLGTNLALLADDDLHFGADGSFTITFGPDEGAGNHMKSAPGKLEIWVRESKSDWLQPPVALSIECRDERLREIPSVAVIAEEIAPRLWEWCSRWATFRMNYLGRPPVNTINGPVRRDGEWGELAGGRWELGADDAIIAEIDPQGAGYFGFMLTDPWGMALDARTTISARNNCQTTLDPDGAATYVISARDPGVENWIGTYGLGQGELRYRWQKTPAAYVSARSIRSYRKVAFADLERELPGLVGKVSPAARQAELDRRAREYDTRWTLAGSK